ncbi:MAG: hypothetical protein GKS06_01485 [Acidobacteria bacterium]|nr:hypothetical protein [Acidobacteriota bacterium]
MSSEFSQQVLRSAVSRPVTLILVLLFVAAGCATAPVERGKNQAQEGVFAADQGYWEEAQFRWLKALAIAEMNARALNNLAVQHERDGEFEAAKDYYDKALVAATPAEHFYVDRNNRQFAPIWERISSGSMDDDKLIDMPLDEFPEGQTAAVGVLEIIVSVPDQGPNLAGYNRLLVGNFVPAEETESNINDFAVRYFRRRITQRTFYETQDQLEAPMDPASRGEEVFDNADYWVERAASSEADLVLTGTIGLSTEQESQMVRERIRSPDGQIREVARFQDVVTYKITFDVVVLRGEDGERLVEQTLESEASYPVEEGVSNQEAVFETLERMLPQLLETITPRRSEQSRYLIY